MEAINNLNKITDLRNNMISYIVNSKATSKMSDKQYDALENKLSQKSFAQLKKEYDTLKAKNQMKNGGGVGKDKVFEVAYYGKKHLKQRGSSKGNYKTWVVAINREEAIEKVKNDDDEFAELKSAKPTNLDVERYKMKNGGGIKGKFLVEIGVPYNYEKVVTNKFEFTEFLSKTLTKKWFGNGVWRVIVVKSLFEKNYSQKIVVEIEIPLGVTQGGGLDKFEVVEFISKTLTKKWFGNGVWSVNVIKNFSKGGGIDINELNIPVIRTQFEDEEYEFKDGGTTKAFCYTIGGL